MSALVFLDTETTGLSLDDDVWEFAAIRREPDGTERTVHLFVEHDVQRCQALPDSFRSDHQRRFPQAEGTGWHSAVSSRSVAAKTIAEVLADGPHVIGAVPNFDTERLAVLLRRYGWEPEWHHHLIDVENLAVGYLHGQYAGQRDRMPAIPLPWDSDVLSRYVGVEPPTEARHTALGDVLWVRAIYDAVTGYTP